MLGRREIIYPSVFLVLYFSTCGSACSSPSPARRLGRDTTTMPCKLQVEVECGFLLLVRLMAVVPDVPQSPFWFHKTGKCEREISSYSHSALGWWSSLLLRA